MFSSQKDPLLDMLILNNNKIAYISTVWKAKDERSGTCYSASYMSQTRDQKRFTISEVAADWHELMIPQRTMQPFIARVSEQLDPRLQLADISPHAPISHIRPSPHSP